MVAGKLPITLELALLSILVALAIAIPAGVVAAVRRNTAWDVLASGVSLAGVSVPNFWLGIMLILLVSVRLGWLPASGYVSPIEDLLGNVKRMIMPAFVLGTGLAAVLMRQTRNSMIEVLSADYVRTARAKGLAGPRRRAAPRAPERADPRRDDPGPADGRAHGRGRRDRADLRDPRLREADRGGGVHARLSGGAGGRPDHRGARTC